MSGFDIAVLSCFGFIAGYATGLLHGKHWEGKAWASTAKHDTPQIFDQDAFKVVPYADYTTMKIALVRRGHDHTPAD